ncbi:MAG: hypothetical protein ACXAAM_08790 [Candidatus Heimdallarchaeaceae archaeon]
MAKKKMIYKRSWSTFRNSGLLWWVNRTLHLFGWAIVYEFDKGKIIDVYPARCKFRGFHRDLEETNFIKLSRYLTKNAKKLLEEAMD